MSKPLDIISRLRRIDASYTKREQLIAEYLLQNLEAAAHLNLAEIANANEVSQATVNRFCKALGCDGFKDFKIKFAQNVAVSKDYVTDLAPVESDTKDFAGRVFSSLSETLAATHAQLDPVVLQRVVEKLATANKIVFVGLGGGSSMVATEGANRLFRIGVTSQACTDGYLQRMISATLGPKDVLFAVSASGAVQDLLDSVEIAKQYQATTICLTRSNSLLSKETDISILLDLKEDSDIYKPSAARLAFLVVIDILATGVAHANSNKSRKVMRRIRASLLKVQSDTGPKPIGD